MPKQIRKLDRAGRLPRIATDPEVPPRKPRNTFAPWFAWLLERLDAVTRRTAER